MLKKSSMAGIYDDRCATARFARRVDPDVARFRPEPRPVIDRQPGLVLPLVHHLVDERVDDLLPPCRRR